MPTLKPPVWEAICRAVGLPTSSSVDRVWNAYGNVVGRGTIQRMQEGVSPRFDSLQKLADVATAGSVDQLLRAGKPDSSRSEPGSADTVSIPLFNTGGKMGEGGLVLRDQPGVIRSWQVNSEWLNKNVRNASAPSNLCIVTGFGDSMRPMFNPGDPLLVDRGVSTVEYDAIYFFRVESEGFIKRLQRIPGQGLIAISENKAYRDWPITADMSFEVFGRVLKVWRGEDY